jgi:hypothetical protein
MTTINLDGYLASFEKPTVILAGVVGFPSQDVS